jgi:P27 family predicted phage terminase small subunit
MPGQLPTPTAILKARGSWRAKTREGEPTTEVCIPEIPEVIQHDEDACKEWNLMISRLENKDILDDIDSGLLARYCHLHAQYVRAERKIRVVYKYETSYPVYAFNDDGEKYIVNIKEYPEIKLMHRIVGLMDPITKHFGMSPATRTLLRTAGHLDKEKTKKILDSNTDVTRFFND